MISVFQLRDKIVFDLHGRRTDVLLPCDAASKLADALDAAAALASAEPASADKGESWGCKVESAYGHVCLRFRSPHAGLPGKVPLPPAVAFKLAEVIRFKRDQAELGLRFDFQRG